MEQFGIKVATVSSNRLVSTFEPGSLAQILWCQVIAGRFVMGSLVLVALIAGCGGGGPPSYTVQGTVTYAEKPVPTGWVIFLASDEQRSTAEIGTDGQYQTELPAGKYQIGISAPRVSDKTAMEAFDERPMMPHVPYRFAMPKSSGLSATIEANDGNRVDLTLKQQKRRRRRR